MISGECIRKEGVYSLFKRQRCTSCQFSLGLALRKSLVIFSSLAQSCPILCQPTAAACQASLSITNSWSLLKLMFIKSVMPSNYLIPCCYLFHLPSIFPSIRVFSNDSVLHIRWPKYWSFIFSINLSNEYSGLISFRID